MKGLRLPLLMIALERTIGSFCDVEFVEEGNESLMRQFTILVFANCLLSSHLIVLSISSLGSLTITDSDAGIVFRHQFLRSVMQSEEPGNMWQKIELALTHSFNRNETTALLRFNSGKPDHIPTYVNKTLEELVQFTQKVVHPLTIPYIVVRHLVSRMNNEVILVLSCSEAQDLLLACNPGQLSISMAARYINSDTGVWNLRRIGRDWADDRRQVLSALSSGAALRAVLDKLQEATEHFWFNLQGDIKCSESMISAHAQLVRGLKVEQTRLNSIETVARELEQRMQALESSVSLTPSMMLVVIQTYNWHRIHHRLQFY